MGTMRLGDRVSVRISRVNAMPFIGDISQSAMTISGLVRQKASKPVSPFGCKVMSVAPSEVSTDDISFAIGRVSSIIRTRNLLKSIAMIFLVVRPALRIVTVSFFEQ